MKGTKKRQVLALGLAAAMVVSNLGTAFAAYNAGTPGSAEKYEEISINLDASGGKFTLTSPAETRDTVTVTAKASDSNATEGGYYAKFGSFKLATDSNAAVNFVEKGPDVKPEDKQEASFGGWYEDLANADTKLTSDSLIYSDVTAHARWVEEVKEIPETLKNDVKGVQVSGLSDVKITEAPFYMKEEIKKNIGGLALGENKDGYKISGEPVIVDIDASQPDEPGMITMDIPQSLKWSDGKMILVMHFQKYNSGELNENEGIQEAAIDKEKGTMTFTAGEFSPFAFVVAEKVSGQETVKVEVENVPGGALIVYNLDEEGNLSLLPIGEAVEVPFGTMLQFRSNSMTMDGGYGRLERDDDNREFASLEMNGAVQSIRPYTEFPVTGDAKITANFTFHESSTDRDQYYLDIDPYRWMDTDKPYEGTIIAYTLGEDNRRVEIEGIRAEFYDYNSNDCANDQFVIEGDRIRSKDGKVLDIGRYNVALNVFLEDGTQIMGWNEDGEYLESGNGNETIHIGVERYFNAAVATYTRVEETHTYTSRAGYYLNSVLLNQEDGSSFEKSREAAFAENEIKSITMYGHELEYWTDSKDNKVDTAQKLDKDYYAFYAHFKGYTPVTLRPLNAADVMLELEDGSAVMKPEDTKVIEVKGKDAAKVTAVDWKSSYDDIVEIESEDGTKAVLKANAVGKATITAVVTVEGKSASVLTQEITVTESGEPEDSNLFISGKSSVELEAEETLRLMGTDVTDVKEVKWESSQPSIVKVVSTGTDGKTATVKAAALGKATVTATATLNADGAEKTVVCRKEITVVKKGTTPGGDDKPGTGGSGWVKPAGNGGSSSNSSATVGGWKRDNRGWMYLSGNGSLLKGQWAQVANVWYYFGTDGYMLTGWQLINGKWYYLTESEAGMGGMKTGWYYDNTYQAWFFFGADGSMLTGWQLINGAWYYLNPGTEGTLGAMAADTQIGTYYVNASGVWVQ